MIPLPSNHVTQAFCGSSARQFDNLVSEEKDIVLQLHLPTKSTRKRGDVTPAVLRPRKRRKGGVFATDRLSSWPRNWRCLEELSAMLADAQGRGGLRKARTGFPLCKHGTSSRQDSTQFDKEAFRDLEGRATLPVRSV